MLYDLPPTATPPWSLIHCVAVWIPRSEFVPSTLKEPVREIVNPSLIVFGVVFAAAMHARRRDTILVLLASILWGTSFPGSKLTVGIVDPLFLTFARTALGALLGLAVLAATRRLDLQVFRQPLVWVLGAINAVGFELQNEGILLTTAAKTALLVNVHVGIIPVLMVLFFREAMTRLKITGILIGRSEERRVGKDGRSQDWR